MDDNPKSCLTVCVGLGAGVLSVCASAPATIRAALITRISFFISLAFLSAKDKSSKFDWNYQLADNTMVKLSTVPIIIGIIRKL